MAWLANLRKDLKLLGQWRRMSVSAMPQTLLSDWQKLGYLTALIDVGQRKIEGSQSKIAAFSFADYA